MEDEASVASAVGRPIFERCFAIAEIPVVLNTRSISLGPECLDSRGSEPPVPIGILPGMVGGGTSCSSSVGSLN